MYSKVFSQIFDSTIADDYQVRHVFQDLLILADQDGVVNMTLPSIARRTNVPIEIITRAIAVLEAPDKESRTPDYEGRRLIRLDDREWGWQIINFIKYRDIASESQRREVQRKRTARFRENGGGDYSKWPATRTRILKRDEYICQYCGDRADSVDHVFPASKGGDERDENLVASCLKCNQTKNNRTPQEAGMQLISHRVTHRVTAEDHRVTPPSVSVVPSASQNGEWDARGRGPSDPNELPFRYPAKREVNLPEVAKPSLEEAKAAGLKLGAPEWLSEDWWHTLDGVGWIDGCHRPVVNWVSHLTKATRKWETDGRPGRGKSPIRVFPSEQKKAIEQSLESHPGRPDGTAYSRSTPEQRADYKTMKQKLKTLNEEIARA